MSRFKSSLYRSYGAYELKATYQKHLLFGMLGACSVVLTFVGVGWALGGGGAPTTGPPGHDDDIDTVWVSADWIEAGEIIRTEDIIDPVAPPPPPPPATEGVVDGYNAIDDSLLQYEDETDGFREEPIHDPFAPQGPFGQGRQPGDGDGEGGGTGELVVAGLPGKDEFVWAEIQPELIHSVQPDYPRFAKDAGLEGRVIVKALVGPEGSVLDAIVFGSSGHLLLDEAALAVAGKYKYKPAIQNGNPIAIWVTYTVEFTLD